LQIKGDLKNVQSNKQTNLEFAFRRLIHT
jgi:hypothetical protein